MQNFPIAGGSRWVQAQSEHFSVLPRLYCKNPRGCGQCTQRLELDGSGLPERCAVLLGSCAPGAAASLGMAVGGTTLQYLSRRRRSTRIHISTHVYPPVSIGPSLFTSGVFNGRAAESSATLAKRFEFSLKSCAQKGSACLGSAMRFVSKLLSGRPSAFINAFRYSRKQVTGCLAAFANFCRTHASSD